MKLAEERAIPIVYYLSIATGGPPFDEEAWNFGTEGELEVVLSDGPIERPVGWWRRLLYPTLSKRMYWRLKGEPECEAIDDRVLDRVANGLGIPSNLFPYQMHERGFDWDAHRLKD
jgi:hypothetical protein